MTYLLDVNVLLGAIWTNHPMHKRVMDGLAGKSLAVCPLSELGFIRISTDMNASIKAQMSDARKALDYFLSGWKVTHIPADLPALKSSPKTSRQVTDAYLAELAHKHGCRLATLDEKITHPAAVVI